MGEIGAIEEYFPGRFNCKYTVSIYRFLLYINIKYLQGTASTKSYQPFIFLHLKSLLVFFQFFNQFFQSFCKKDCRKDFYIVFG